MSKTIRYVNLKMHNCIKRKLQRVRYIPNMTRYMISLRRLEIKGYTTKTQNYRVLKVAGVLCVLKKCDGKLCHVFLSCRGLHHIEGDTRIKLSRRLTFVDGDHLKMEVDSA